MLWKERWIWVLVFMEKLKISQSMDFKRYIIQAILYLILFTTTGILSIMYVKEKEFFITALIVLILSFIAIIYVIVRIIIFYRKKEAYIIRVVRFEKPFVTSYSQIIKFPFKTKDEKGEIIELKTGNLNILFGSIEDALTNRNVKIAYNPITKCVLTFGLAEIPNKK